MPTTRTRTRSRTTRTRTTRTRSRTPRVLKAEIGRFDGDMHNVHFTNGDTVQALLGKAGISLSEGESITDERGDDVTASDEAKSGKVYYITGNYKQGY